MKLLLILRHARAVRDDAVDDRERPLLREGLHDAARVGQILQREGLRPDVVLSSPAARALSTARAVLEATGAHVDVRIAPELYGAEAEEIPRLLSGLAEPASCVLIVGHNPSLEGLVSTLTGRGATLYPASLAVIELAIERFSELARPARGTLRSLLRPAD